MLFECYTGTIEFINSTWYNTIQYNTIQYNTIQYNTIQYNTIQYNTKKMFIQGIPYHNVDINGYPVYKSTKYNPI